MSALQLAAFRVGTCLWAIDVLQVREVLHRADTTPVPHAPSHVRGLMNLRGHIITVIDLARRLGTTGGEDAEGGMCVLLRTSAELGRLDAEGRSLVDTGHDSVALRVDGVDRVLDVAGHDLLPPPANLEAGLLPFVRGVVRLDEGLLLVLRLEAVLS